MPRLLVIQVLSLLALIHRSAWNRTGVRGIEILRSPYPAICIAAVHYPLIGARLWATHRTIRMVNNI
jgi:hypothetical protein